MRTIVPVIAAAGLLFAPAVSAAEKPGKPLDMKSSGIKSNGAMQSLGNWRDRALKARAAAEFEPGAPQSGRARALNERGDRPDEEVGAGALGEDTGEGGSKRE